MKNVFSELPWHDAEIVYLNIDRSKPGEVDELVLKVAWPDESKSFLRFVDCYWILLQMNMGIVAPESILSVEHKFESEILSTVKEQWKKMGEELVGMNHFIIVTNSTNSRLEIICKQLVNVTE